MCHYVFSTIYGIVKSTRKLAPITYPARVSYSALYHYHSPFVCFVVSGFHLISPVFLVARLYARHDNIAARTVPKNIILLFYFKAL